MEIVDDDPTVWKEDLGKNGYLRADLFKKRQVGEDPVGNAHYLPSGTVRVLQTHEFAEGAVGAGLWGRCRPACCEAPSAVFSSSLVQLGSPTCPIAPGPILQAP